MHKRGNYSVCISVNALTARVIISAINPISTVTPTSMSAGNSTSVLYELTTPCVGSSCVSGRDDGII